MFKMAWTSWRTSLSSVYVVYRILEALGDMNAHLHGNSVSLAYIGEVAPSLWQAPAKLVARQNQPLQLQQHLVLQHIASVLDGKAR